MEGFMFIVSQIARVLLGSVFLVFGLNGFFNFLPYPDMTLEGMTFIHALIDTGYMMTLVKSVEVVSGLLILSGGKREFVGLVLLAPVLVNIFLFHLFLDHNGLLFSLALVLLFKIRVIANKEHYSHIIDFSLNSKR